MTDTSPTALLSFRLQNWRCVDDVRLEVAREGATWLVGANGSGKSSLLDGLAFVSDVMHHGQGALDATLRGQVGAGAERILFTEIARDAAEPVRWEIRFEVEGRRYLYVLALRARGQGFLVEDERLTLDVRDHQTVLLENDGVTARWLAGGTVEGDGLLEPAFEQNKALLMSHAVKADKLPALAPAYRFLRGIWLFRLDLLLMRGATASPKQGRPLDRYGRDLLAYLAAAQQDPQLTSALAEASEALGWERLGFVVDEDGHHLRFVDPYGYTLDFSAASVGQSVHAILVLMALYPPDEASVMLFDEPAVAVDVRQAAALGSYLEFLSNARSVLAATQAVDALGRGERGHVRFLVRGKQGGVRVRTLAEVAFEDELSGLYGRALLTRETLLLHDAGGALPGQEDG